LIEIEYVSGPVELGGADPVQLRVPLLARAHQRVIGGFVPSAASTLEPFLDGNTCACG